MELKEKLVVLSEGLADKNFLTTLMNKRKGYPAFDAPYPDTKLHGSSAFQKMLSAIRGDQKSFTQVRGVLIVADSAKTPRRTFTKIKQQIQAAGGYPVPNGPEVVAARTTDHPSVAVMLLPDPNIGGGLESLCVEEILARKPWARNCVDRYLQCNQMLAHRWPPEKKDKARYHCLVAGLNQNDPSKAVSHAFEGSPPLIDVQSSVFDDVATRLNRLCTSLLT